MLWDLIPDAPYHFTGMQWWMNTSLMHPFLLVSPYPSIPFQGKWDHCKVTSLCRHLGGCSMPGLQDLPFLCTDCFWHTDKSRGRWQSTCAWNSLSFITNHQGPGSMVTAQPHFYFGVIKVHSLVPGSLEGWDFRASTVTLPQTHAISWDMHLSCPCSA